MRKTFSAIITHDHPPDQRLVRPRLAWCVPGLSNLWTGDLGPCLPAAHHHFPCCVDTTTASPPPAADVALPLVLIRAGGIESRRCSRQFALNAFVTVSHCLPRNL
ncbi:hypothetical protein GWI33_003090 [Rhynchophorus ferrugineus]|uniref:Uncharacterized protein n=1 Tax=Rhynchophorus ferrugineus TaxID=354439 RepID=A0A834MH97_RHYFE|nr:hypothetical protein GWI33_003090 [Rhynchophorus ferrugineus]